MPDAALFGWPPETTQYRVRIVPCPHKAVTATVTAATWMTAGDAWTQWDIVDCSLMPAGCVLCDRACLAHLESAA